MSFKIFIFLIVYTLIGSAEGSAQDYNRVLERADSLFTLKKYTQSYQLYDSIYSHGQLSSSQMLLKMAYIQEGLGDYTQALFHLNEYYIQTSDDRVLEKMQTMGSNYNLKGYDYSESDFFVSLYHQYYNQLITGLILLSLILLAGLIYQKIRLKEKPVVIYIVFIVSALLLAGVINTGMGYQEGIITHSSTYIMSSPSSSSEVLAIVDKGNKIPIKKSYDVWLKTEWDEQTAYIKKKNVTPITSW